MMRGQDKRRERCQAKVQTALRLEAVSCSSLISNVMVFVGVSLFSLVLNILLLLLFFCNSKDAIPIEAEVIRQKRKKSGDVYQ